MVDRLCTDNCSAIDHRLWGKFHRRAASSYNSEEIIVDALTLMHMCGRNYQSVAIDAKLLEVLYGM